MRTNITDTELARRVGTSRRMIVYVRRGERKMSPELRQRVADELGVSPSIVELVLRREAR